MTAASYVNVALELGCAVLCACLLCGTWPDARRGERQNRLFMRLLVCDMLLVLSDTAAWLLKGHPGIGYRIGVQVSNALVFSLSYLMMLLFLDYLLCHISTNTRVSKLPVWLLRGLCACGWALVALSQLNGWIYYVDANNMYCRGELFWLSRALGVAGVTVYAATLLYYRRYVSRRDGLLLLSYMVLAALAMLAQLLQHGIAWLHIAATLSLLIVYIGLQADLNRRYHQKELELIDSRITVMLSQIQPHFLFNALTGISRLCDVDAKRAKVAVTDFAAYLRMNLNALTQKGPIPLEKELEHTREYLNLEQMRFPDELDVVFDVKATGALLPALTIQPLAENAVKHGLGPGKEHITITIRTWQDERALYICVADDGVGFAGDAPMDTGASHVGIESLRRRVGALCGGTLTLTSTPGAGTTALITLPCQKPA